MYGGRGSEKEMVIMKLRSDLRSLQSAQDETNQQLLERDKQIADLQVCFIMYSLTISKLN